MTLLDRYIVYNFFKQMVLWYITLLGMFIIVDIFQNLDSYFSVQGTRSPWEVMGIHYFYISFSVVDMLLPLLIVMSALGLTVGMLRRNEFIALQSSGISKFRAICPFLASAILLSLASLWVREVFIPRHMLDIVQTTSELANPEGGISAKQTEDNYTKIKLGGDKVFPHAKEIAVPHVFFPMNYFGLGVGEIQGKTGVYAPATKDHPTGYLIQNVSKGSDLLQKPSLTLRETGYPVLLTPADCPWLKSDECFVISGISLQRLMVGQQWLSLASVSQLLREMGNPSSNYNPKDVEINIHARILRPLVDLIPVFIALPFLLLRNNQGAFRGMAIGGGLALAFIGIQFLCLHFGPRFNLVVLAPWLPILLFTPIIVNVFWRLCH